MEKRNIKYIKDISGFGKDTDYEKTCQNMLQAGYDWLCDNPNPDLKASTYKNIYGIMNIESDEAKQMEKAVLAVASDCSGAMHQAVMSILFYISKSGIDEFEKVCKAKKLGFDGE